MQLEELEIISSIYCGPRELVIDDPSVIVDMNSFISGESTTINRELDYRIQMTITGLKDRLEVFFELPHYYPALELPRITLSYPNISTNQHQRLKGLVDDALTVHRRTDETFLFALIAWLTDDEEVQRVLTNDATGVNAKGPGKRMRKMNSKESLEKPQRIWIYSHHIKSKRKRASIIENARDLHLTGFSLPGKPGIICVEGYQTDVQEFWRTIKAMKWQRIQIRLEETGEEGVGEEAMTRFRKFNKFEEETKFAVNNLANSTTEAHDSDDEENNAAAINGDAELVDEEILQLNMSTFSTYLEQHNCGHVMAIVLRFKAS